jgi:DNA-binding CsgD family transcriptional regulator/PAS domain-containing protein
MSPAGTDERGATPDPALVNAVRTSATPIALLDLTPPRIVAASETAWQLLGAPSPPPLDLDPTSIAEHPQLARDVLHLLATGGLEAYQACRRLRRVGGGLVDAALWARVIGTERRWAVLTVVSIPCEGPVADAFEGPVLSRTSDVVIGAVDHDWVVTRISVEVTRVLGASPEDCLGRPFLGLVHPADATGLLAAVTRVLETGAGVGIDVRLRAGSEPWHLVSAVIAPSDDGDTAFCFVLTALDRADREQERVTDLERRLWNIALEVRAAGVLGAVDQLPDPKSLPGLSDLTSRQWEVLSRLLRGQRVPAIAREMFLSQSTVRNHLSTIFGKAGVHSQEALLELFHSQADQPRRIL